ncbi:MAG: hypothetical protein ACE5E4_13490, partial [Candidatus Binatia bacterium]
LDVGVEALSNIGFTLALLGFPDQALTRVREAVSLAEELSHPFSLAFALIYAAIVHGHLGDWRALRESADALMTISTEHGFSLYLLMGASVKAMMPVQRVPVEEDIEEMRQLLDAFEAADMKLRRPFSFALMAQWYGGGGQPSEGLALIAEAEEIAEKTGERWSDAEIHRVKGELLLLESKDDAAERCFHKAIEVARKQQAKSWELVASTGLARLWQRQGKKDEAHKLLSDIYGWFTEGFDTAPLRDVKELLEELS